MRHSNALHDRINYNAHSSNTGDSTELMIVKEELTMSNVKKYDRFSKSRRARYMLEKNFYQEDIKRSQF